MNKNKFSRTFFHNFFLLSALSLASGCYLADLANPPVHFVLPDNYRGMFKIVLDEKVGTAAKIDGRRYLYEIPADGILTVNDLSPLRQMHEETAEYRNGKPLVISDGRLPDGDVALRSVGQYTRGKGPFMIIFVVGTKTHVDKVARDFANPTFDEPPPSVYNQQLLKP